MAVRHSDLVPTIDDRGARRAARLALRGLAAVWAVTPTRFTVVLCSVGLLLGASVGAMVAVLPLQFLVFPAAVIGLVVALIPLTFPEMRRVPIRATRILFFAFVAAEMTLPVYVAITAPGLPFISIVRVFLAPMAIAFLVCVACSADVRKRMAAAISSEKPICYAVFALFVAFALSLPLSRAPLDSIRILGNLITGWWLPFFAAIFVLDTDRRQEAFFRLFIFCAIFAVALSCVEFFKAERLFLRLVPASVLERDPTFVNALAMSVTRDGRYRASAHFNVPLSYGEYCSLVLPVAMYFVMYGRRMGDRVLGAVGIIAALVGVFVANSRGGTVGVIAGGSIFAILYSANAVLRKKGSLVGSVLVVLLPIGLSVVPAMMLAFPRVNKLVLGGAEAQNSTDDRFLQWTMAWPKILKQPVTGYGLGNGADVIGYMKSSGGYSVDSYPLTLLVDAGILGLIAFCAVVLIMLWRAPMVYLRHPDPASAKAIALASAFVAFALQRLTLSQTENMTTVFLMLGFFVALQHQLRASAVAPLAVDRRRPLDGLDNGQAVDVAPKKSGAAIYR
jgi:O-antigen ligase